MICSAICLIRCWSSSAWTRISPISSLIAAAECMGQASRTCAPCPPEPGSARRWRRRAPRRSRRRRPRRAACTPLARDLAVREEVLERLACRRGRAGASGRRPARRTSSARPARGGQRPSRAGGRLADRGERPAPRGRPRPRADAPPPGGARRTPMRWPPRGRDASAVAPATIVAVRGHRAPAGGSSDASARERRGRVPGSASAASTAASSTAASSRSAPACAETLASAAGCSSSSARKVSARGCARARALLASSRHASPRSRAVRRRLARGSRASSGRTTRPERSGMPEQRAPPGR